MGCFSIWKNTREDESRKADMISTNWRECSGAGNDTFPVNWLLAREREGEKRRKKKKKRKKQ
jgi:hypothetical protein